MSSKGSKRIVSSVMIAASIGAGSIIFAPVSEAATPPKGVVAINYAEKHKGDPYVLGGKGPHKFDCSGLTWRAFQNAGHKWNYHTAQSQYNLVKHVSKSNRKRGDLVFFHSGSSVYHVAIYDGHNYIWHAPHTGATVRKEKMWTQQVWYGRIK